MFYFFSIEEKIKKIIFWHSNCALESVVGWVSEGGSNTAPAPWGCPDSTNPKPRIANRPGFDAENVHHERLMKVWILEN